MAEQQTLVRSILNRHKSKIRAPHLDKASTEIIEGLAFEFGLSEKQIREVVTAPYLIIKNSRQNLEEITEEGFLTYRIPYFGKLTPRKGRVTKYVEMKKEK